MVLIQLNLLTASNSKVLIAHLMVYRIWKACEERKLKFYTCVIVQNKNLTTEKLMLRN